MLRSNLCVLSEQSPYTNHMVKEGEYDYGGYFIVDGKEKVISSSGEYPDINGEFVSVETKLIKKGYEPPIHDFSIELKIFVDFNISLAPTDVANAF